MKSETRSIVIVVSVVALLFMLIILLKPKISIGSGASNINNPFGGPVNGGVPMITQNTTGPIINTPGAINNPFPEQTQQMENGPGWNGVTIL